MIPKKPMPLFIIAFVLVMLSCASKKESDHANDRDGHTEWREMDDFHMIMAETFHPFRDSADLEPVKKKASALMTAAHAWASTPLPERVNNDEMRSKLDLLKVQATTLAESVQSQDDHAIGQHLSILHDTFHKIQEAWYESD